MVLEAKKPRGIIPALSTITSEKKGGEVDEESERSLVDACIEWGSSGLAVSIVAGEFYKFTDEERRRTFEVVVDEANGRVPVWAGIAHLGTASSIKLASYAKDSGADGVIAQPALVGKDAEQGLAEHFFAIFEKVELPIMIQDAEDFNGVRIDPRLYLDLADKFDNFASVKIEGGRTLEKIKQARGMFDAWGRGKDSVTILGGMGGRLLLEELELGTAGSIPNSCMVDLVVAAFRNYTSGRTREAREVFEKYRPWLEFQSRYPLSALEIVKETLRLRGVVASSHTRVPHVPMSEKAKQELRELLGRMGMLEM